MIYNDFKWFLMILNDCLQDSKCSSHPCKYGGTCTADGSDDGYTCSCREGIFGDQCEVCSFVVKISTFRTTLISQTGNASVN